jgi:hypothetical protein
MTDKENSGAAGNSPGMSPGAEDHADELMSAAPDVQAHVIQQQQADAAATTSTENSATAKLDKFGVAFDASKHTGSLLKNGGWRERKISGSTLAKPNKKKAAASAEATSDLDAQSMAAGAAAANSFFAVSTMMFGAEWQPLPKSQIGYDELELMSKSFGDYFKAKGVTDFPPGATLAMVMIGAIGMRMQMPETKKKMGGVRNWFGLRFAKWKVKREFKKRGIAARVEIRNGELLFDGKKESEFRAEKK